MKRGRTVSCSSSIPSEDGEVDDPGAVSLITELAPGRWILMDGNSQEEAGIVDTKENKEREERRGQERREETSSPKKREPISAFNFKNRGGGKIGDERQIP